MVDLKTLISVGNLKVGDDTLIFNMNAAADCPAEALGLCAIADKCYAKKAEKQYPSVLNYRRLQEEVWDFVTEEYFLGAVASLVKSRRAETKYFRFSESGDFRTQADVDKMTAIAKGLLDLGLQTYGYTARSDLNLKELMKVATVQGSGFMASNEFKPVKEFSAVSLQCPGSCKPCRICKLSLGKVIEVLIH